MARDENWTVRLAIVIVVAGVAALGAPVWQLAAHGQAAPAADVTRVYLFEGPGLIAVLVLAGAALSLLRAPLAAIGGAALGVAGIAALLAPPSAAPVVAQMRAGLAVSQPGLQTLVPATLLQQFNDAVGPVLAALEFRATWIPWLLIAGGAAIVVLSSNAKAA